MKTHLKFDEIIIYTICAVIINLPLVGYTITYHNNPNIDVIGLLFALEIITTSINILVFLLIAEIRHHLDNHK